MVGWHCHHQSYGCLGSIKSFVLRLFAQLANAEMSELRTREGIFIEFWETCRVLWSGRTYSVHHFPHLSSLVDGYRPAPFSWKSTWNGVSLVLCWRIQEVFVFLWWLSVISYQNIPTCIHLNIINDSLIFRLCCMWCMPGWREKLQSKGYYDVWSCSWSENRLIALWCYHLHVIGVYGNTEMAALICQQLQHLWFARHGLRHC